MTALLGRPRTAPPRRPTTRAPVVNDDVRRTLLTLAASMLGALPLCALFTDLGWIVDVWLTMLVVIGPAAVLRARRTPSAAQIWVGVLLLVPWLTVSFVRENAVLGVFPLGGAWHDVHVLLQDLHTTTTDQVAPVESTVAIRLALCTLLGLAAALVDLLAVVGRRGALAGVPLLVVFTVAGAVPRQPVAWYLFVAGGAAFLILLAVDGSDDARRWGHVVRRSRRTGRRTRTGVRAAQRIATGAIVLALAVPVVVPDDPHNFLADLFHPGAGNGADGFGADRNSGSGSGGIDPFAALRGQLNRDKNIDLFDVTIGAGSGGGGRGGAQPFYLRTNILSSYQGDGWRPSRGPDTTEPIARTQFASAPGQPYPGSSVTFGADITVRGLRSNPPVFATPTAVSGVDPDATRWSTRDLLMIGSRTTDGEKIHEDVAQAQPSLAELRSAPDAEPSLAPWTVLPAVSAYVRTLTTQATRDAGSSPYARARALSDFFADPANGFTYSLTTGAGDSGDDLTSFLRNRVGYCQQYAAALAVMMRLSDIPARVVLGYAHKVPDETGSFTVTAYDAHAWVEGYFSGIGWVPFDPTPLDGISGGAANDLPWAPHDTTSAKPSRVTAPPVTRPSTAVARPRGNASGAAAADGGMSPALIGLVVLGVVLLVLAAVLSVPALVRLSRRRSRLRRARSGDTDALWAELSATAVDLGYVWSAARTPRQVAAWLGSTPGAPSESLRSLTSAVERARYARDPGTPQDLVDHLENVEFGLRERRSARERRRAVLWPASLGWQLPHRPGRPRGRRAG